MAFVRGFQKTAQPSDEHHKAGLIAVGLNSGASAVYSHFKAPRHRQKSPEKNYLKHRTETMKGFLLGTAAGGLGGAALSHAGERIHSAIQGKPYKHYRLHLPQAIATAIEGKKARSIPLALVPAVLGALVGSHVGTYHGAIKGHEAVTGKKRE
jgi:hypothetical protein